MTLYRFFFFYVASLCLFITDGSASSKKRTSALFTSTIEAHEAPSFLSKAAPSYPTLSMTLQAPLHRRTTATLPHQIAKKRLHPFSILDSLCYVAAYPEIHDESEAILDSVYTRMMHCLASRLCFESSQTLISTWQTLPLIKKRTFFLILQKATQLILDDSHSSFSSYSIATNSTTYTHSSHISYEDWTLYLMLTASLSNRKLQGFYAQSVDDVAKIDSAEVDVARSLYLEYSQAKEACMCCSNNLDTTESKKILFSSSSSLPSSSSSSSCAVYSLSEVALDIIALDVLYKEMQMSSFQTERRAAVYDAKNVPFHKERVDLINAIFFDDMRIRFPSKTASEKYIDRFSSIEDVLSSKRGVCLGVTTMYIAVLQRLGALFYIYTPPGHIFISCLAEQSTSFYKERVVETTARGIHIPLSSYLDSRLLSLPKKSLKDVPGMVLMNDASCALQEKKYEEAYLLYERAYKYMADNSPDLLSFMAFAAFMTKRSELARDLAKRALMCDRSDSCDGDPISFDIFYNNITEQDGELLVEATKTIDFEKRNLLLTKIQERIAQTAHHFHKGSILLYSLWADLAMQSLSTTQAIKALHYIYTRWKKAQEKKDISSLYPFSSAFMGLPFLITLAELYLQRSDIPCSTFFAKEALLFYQAAVAKKQSMLLSIQSHTLPCELHALLMALCKKSPTCLEDISTSSCYSSTDIRR